MAETTFHGLIGDLEKYLEYQRGEGIQRFKHTENVSIQVIAVRRGHARHKAVVDGINKAMFRMTGTKRAVNFNVNNLAQKTPGIHVGYLHLEHRLFLRSKIHNPAMAPKPTPGCTLAHNTARSTRRKRSTPWK